MNTRVFTLCLITISLLVTGADAQNERLDSARSQIIGLLTGYQGGAYIYWHGSQIVDVDSSIGQQGIAYGNITNPYGTLNNCFLFFARRSNLSENRFIMGVFRDNSILWASEEQPGDFTLGEFWGTLDMNQDGFVEILAGWVNKSATYQQTERMTVHRWNGSSATPVYDRLETNDSKIIGQVQGFTLVDVDGDGAIEITATEGDVEADTTSFGKVVYCWNGSEFGMWATCTEIDGRKYTVANNMEIEVACKVDQVAEKLRYVYSVSNDSLSFQALEELFVQHRTDSISIIGQPLGWAMGDLHEFHLIPFFSSTGETIAPGEGVVGLSFESKGLPTIAPYFAQAPEKLLGDLAENDAQWDQEYIDDVITNSVMGITVAPTNPPSPFTSVDFIDTLESFILRGRTLGWITDDPTASKYTRLIDSARANLQANIRGVTKSKLDSVLLNVIADSSTTLTSEAYALLRFNTEYVLQKLREEDSAFAAGNTSSSWDATATNNARHVAKSADILHEVFTTGGEIFYRRSDDGGSTWGQTHQINTAFGENSNPCIATTESGSVHVVWQRRIASTVLEVWHAFGQDQGGTWSSPVILPSAGQVQVSQVQTEGAMPVIVERRAGSLVVVYCSEGGLQYRTSDDDGQSWQIPNQEINGAYTDVQFPSLASDGSSAWLVYDYVNDASGPYSRTFDGTNWNGEVTIAAGTDTDNGSSPSISIDLDGCPVATWSAISTNMSWGRAIVVCLGYADNTWNKWFTMFGQNYVDWLNPSVTYYSREGSGEYGVAVVNHTSQNYVKEIQLTEPEPPSWDVGTLSESGKWGALTLENSSSGTPIHCWTDQGSSPYEVMIGSSTMSPRLSPATLRHTRAAVIRQEGATLMLEFESMKVVLANGDTSLVSFKPSSLRKENITLENMWDYLGSDTLRLPENARRLVVTKRFASRGRFIGLRQVHLHLLNTGGNPIAVLDTTSSSGTISVNIAPYAGTNVILRPQVVLGGIDPLTVRVSVGDILESPSGAFTRPPEERRK